MRLKEYTEKMASIITVTYVYRKIFDRLPAEPYKAVCGDKLADIELPYGWVFDDVLLDPDATVGDEGAHILCCNYFHFNNMIGVLIYN